MKRSQWTLPRGHRANLVAHVWTFPLFFGSRERIDILNNRSLDPLFAITQAYIPDPINNDGTLEERLEQSYNLLGHATAYNLIALYIAEMFGRSNGIYHVPFEAFIAKHPIPTPANQDEAKQIARSLYDIEGPWRAYIHDHYILTHCSGLNTEMKCWENWDNWENWKRKLYVLWTRFDLDENELVTGVPKETFKVILRL